MRRVRFAVLPSLILVDGSESTADTVHLRNGRKMQGILASAEGDPSVVLEVGISGRMVFSPSEVLRLERSNPQEREAIRKGWMLRKAESDVQIEKAQMEGRLRQAEEAKKPKSSHFIFDGHAVYVRAVVNGSFTGTFLIDTGAPLVILTWATAEKLGLSLSPTERYPIYKSEFLGRSWNMKITTISTIRVEDAEARRVLAEIMLDSSGRYAKDLKDGILGMSFLRLFKFEIDTATRKLTLTPRES